MGELTDMKADWMARARMRETIVGAFLLLVFVGLAYFTILLSHEAWFRPKTMMEVVFEEVMGLREGDSVVVRGMPIGKVKRLELQPDGVHVYLALEQPVTLRSDYRITVVPTSILGGRMLQMDEGSPGLPVLPPGTRLVGQRPYDMMAEAAELVHAIRRGVVEGAVLSNLQAAAQQLRDVADRVASGQGTLGRLLSADDTLYRDLAAAVSSLRAIAERLEKGEGTLGRMLAEDSRLYEDLTATLASLRTITDGLERGQGVLGRLLKDDSLYLEIQEAVSELRATIDDFRETAPLTTFSSVFFGAF